MMTRFLCSRFFSGYAFWLQPARTCWNSSLPLYHGLPRRQNGQLRGRESSLENSQVDCSRSLFGAGRPYGRCHGRKYGISHVYWKRGSLQVSNVIKNKEVIWGCGIAPRHVACVKSCMSCVQACENTLSWVIWIVLFVVIWYWVELLELRDLCLIGYIATVF